jgi:hypothetical protein
VDLGEVSVGELLSLSRAILVELRRRQAHPTSRARAWSRFTRYLKCGDRDNQFHDSL